MKIGLVCPYIMFRGGGVQEVILALADELERRGHEVSIISPRPRGFDGEIPKNHILLGTATDVRTFSTTPSLSISVDNDEIDRILNEGKFDVLHFHEPWIPMLSRQIMGRSSTVHIGTVHAKLPESIAIKTLTSVVTPYIRSVIKNIDAFTAVSEAAAEYLHSVSNDLDVKIIPNGINLQKYHSDTTPKQPKDPTILFIGRLEKRKGAKYLLRAFAELLETTPHVKLTIAGDGNDREKLELEAQDLGITKSVEFLGFIDEEQKVELLRSCTVFCSPALYGESFGIVLLEAMASGVPIVAGDNPGYASVLREHGKMSLIDPKNTSEFAQRLEMFINDEDMRQMWLDWAKDYVVQFDYPKVIDQYEALYKQVVRG